jgi:two-component system LytT family response regulator
MRFLLVESDPALRRKIMGLVSCESERSFIRECESGLAAIPTIREFEPEILICEVEAPGVDGFSLLESLPEQLRPATIFLSNNGYFAARAFDVGAIDYVLKPVRDKRFLQALQRATLQVNTYHSVVTPQKKPRKLSIKSGRSVILVEPDELNWVDAEGKYVRLHLRREILLLKMSISALEHELDPARFVRIHRSTIVNMDRVRQIQPWHNRRTYQVTLDDGTRLVLSRGMKQRTAIAK